MENTYFNNSNVNILSSILQKIVRLPRSSYNKANITNMLSIIAAIPNILSNDFFYSQVLEDEPEVDYLFKKYSKGDWKSKYFLYISLKSQIPYAVHCIEILNEKNTNNHDGLFWIIGHNKIYLSDSFNCIEYFDVPGIDFEKIKTNMLIVSSIPINVDNYYGPTIYEIEKDGTYLMMLVIFRAGIRDPNLSYSVKLNKYQLKILLIGMLYSNVEITDTSRHPIF